MRRQRRTATPSGRQLTARHLPRTGTFALPRGYLAFLSGIKARIQSARTRASLAVSRELLRLYWQIGREIVRRQEVEGWGASVIEHLAADIGRAFPGIEGFSPRNIWRMRAFHLSWRPLAGDLAQAMPELDVSKFAPSRPPILTQAVTESSAADLPAGVPDLPWGHHVVLLGQVKNRAERLWYARAAISHGWSRAILSRQIASGLHRRQGCALTNFAATLPPPQSDLAREALKDQYNFEFLTLGEDAQERDLERGLLRHVRNFLLEMGAGFAFVGSQVPLRVGNGDYFIDLLFYHLRLRCYVVVDVKTGVFRPEHAGKMNFYLSAVDDLMRHPDDRPSIGIVLCANKDRMVAEYALRDLSKPLGIATFRLAEKLPPDVVRALPSVREIEAGFRCGVPRGRRNSNKWHG